MSRHDNDGFKAGSTKRGKAALDLGADKPDQSRVNDARLKCAQIDASKLVQTSLIG